MSWSILSSSLKEALRARHVITRLQSRYDFLFDPQWLTSSRDDSRPYLLSSWCGLPGVWARAGPGEAAGRWKNTWGQAKKTHSDRKTGKPHHIATTEHDLSHTGVKTNTVHKAVKKSEGFLNRKDSVFPLTLPIYSSHLPHQTTIFQLHVFTINNISGVSWSYI